MFLRRGDWRELGNFLTGDGCLVGVVLLLGYVLILAMASKAIGRVSPEHRRIEPAQVWLNLLPVFHLVWLPVTVDRIAQSLRAEFRARGRVRIRDGYGGGAGLTAVTLVWVGFFLLPLGIVFLVLAVIYWLAYWVQLGVYARRLREEPSEYATPVDEGW